jgi:hypothetical protein
MKPLRPASQIKTPPRRTFPANFQNCFYPSVYSSSSAFDHSISMDVQTAGRHDQIQAAFENAIRDFKATLGDEKILGEILKIKSVEDIYDATDALQKEQMKTGRLRHLAKIQPYLEGLRGYASVIEIFVQSKQEVFALIWGPIKLLLHWTHSLKQSFDAIVGTFADIGLLLPEFQEVRKLFSENEHIKDVLVFFFRDILDFYLIVLKFFGKTCEFIR